MRTLVPLLLLGVSACGASSPGPADTLRAYGASLREGDARAAWQLLSSRAREGTTFEQFERTLRAHAGEARALGASYASVASDDGATARLELPDGEALTMRVEGGRWRLDPAALDFYPQDTPRQCLLSFVRALRRERWEVLLRLAPRDVAAQLEARAAAAPAEGSAPRTAADVLRAAWTGRAADEVSHMASELAQALERGRPIEVMGERATMTYGPGAQSTARLVREDGRWRVEHPE